MSVIQTTKHVCVVTTCPGVRFSQKISKLLIKQKLAACVQILPHVRSVFQWKNKITQAQEQLLMIKTTRTKINAIKILMDTHHPYDVPEFLCIPILAGSKSYLSWMNGVLK